MSSFTDDLMKQILGYAELTARNLVKMESSINPSQKPIMDETQNEVTKMIYRTKDFEQVYNISENKFRSNSTEFHLKKTIEEVRDIVSDDLRKKNIEIHMRFNEDIPIMI